jgi:acetylglutamate/LysW-gamma-L-alpha-aminoadipate kinase
MIPRESRKSASRSNSFQVDASPKLLLEKKSDSMIVIKAGGGEGIHYESVCDEIAMLYRDGKRPLLVHGGSHLTNQLSELMGHPPRFVTSPGGFVSRFTDRKTMEIFMMAYCGHTNKTIVEGLQKRGVNAVGLSGLDGRLWLGTQKPEIKVVENGRQRIVRGNLTGTVKTVNSSWLEQILANDMVPVLCPPAVTENGTAINVDGDRAAATTAAQLRARELVILSNVPGVMRDIHDSRSRIDSVSRSEIDSVSAEFARGRMKIKLLAAAAAIDGGVSRVVIADARPEQCISRALAGEGTVITA